MFVARSTQTGQLLALPSAPVSDKNLSRVIHGDDARLLSTTLRCADVHCDASLTFRQGEKRTAHWAHKSGEGLDCAEREGGEGEWHRRVCRDLLAGAAGHEYAVDDARVDVVIRRTQTSRLSGIEVQHSRLDVETVLHRHAAHVAAGLVGTVWLVDGTATGVLDGPTWRVDDDPRLPLRHSWLIDLLTACRDTPMPYGCTVGLLVPNAADGRHGVRFIREVEFGHDVDGARTATIRKWSQRVGETTLREWAKGPNRVLDPRMETSRRILDSTAEMRVKEWKYNPWRDGPSAA